MWAIANVEASTIRHFQSSSETSAMRVTVEVDLIEAAELCINPIGQCHQPQNTQCDPLADSASAIVHLSSRPAGLSSRSVFGMNYIFKT